MRRLRLSVAVLTISIPAFGFGFSVAADAKVTRLEIASKQSYGTFRPGEFVWWQGRVVGELRPTEKIPDLDKAPRNANGLVEYSAKISLIFPKQPEETATVRCWSTSRTGAVPMHRRSTTARAMNRSRPAPSKWARASFRTAVSRSPKCSGNWDKAPSYPPLRTAPGKSVLLKVSVLQLSGTRLTFWRTRPPTASGTANPLSGAVKRTLASGKSQSGRYLKTFLLNGFNIAEGRRVFDGMHVFVSGAGMLPIMQSGTGPQSSATGAPSFENPEFRGVNEDVLTIGDIVKRVESRGEKPPLMLMINSTTDYFSLRASLSRTGAEGTAEQPFPDNVRVYDIAGASHVVLRRVNCELPPAKLDWSPVSRATLLHLDDWVAKGTEPPKSRLMPLEEARGDPTVLRAPSHLAKAIIEIPKRDEDGNAVGGVRLPDMQAPLGVNARQNPPLSFLCMLAGAYVAFPFAQADADAAHDPHRPVLERYKTRNDYVNRIRIAARELERDGFLLPDDATIIIQSAAENPLWRATAP